MDVIAWIFLLVALALCVHLLRRRSTKQHTRRAIHALKIACGGDQELAERLIFAELQRHPGIDYAEAAARALANVRRDRR